MSTLDPSDPEPESARLAINDEICRASVALMFLLEGLQAVRDRRQLGADRDHREYDGIDAMDRLPMLDEMAVALTLQSERYDVFDMIAGFGDAEELAFRAWLDRLVQVTQSEHRDLVTSELHLIYQDVSENGGVASANASGRCTHLTWFRVGEPMQFGMRHVLDLLNQRRLLSCAPVDDPSRREAKWLSVFLAAREVEADSAPPIVSVRESSPQSNGLDGSDAVVAVFADGLVLEIPIPGLAPDGHDRPQRSGRTRIDGDGNLLLGDGTTLDSRTLYDDALDSMLNG